MQEFQIMNLVYLLLLLIVVIYFTKGSYKGNTSKAVKHAITWIAIGLGLFLILRLFGY